VKLIWKSSNIRFESLLICLWRPKKSSRESQGIRNKSYSNQLIHTSRPFVSKQQYLDHENIDFLKPWFSEFQVIFMQCQRIMKSLLRIELIVNFADAFRYFAIVGFSLSLFCSIWIYTWSFSMLDYPSFLKNQFYLKQIVYQFSCSSDNFSLVLATI